MREYHSKYFDLICVDVNNTVLGIITDCYSDDERSWIVIDEHMEVLADDCELLLDDHGDYYVKLKSLV